MEYQRKAWWCGPASIVNAMKVFGMQKNQATIAKGCAVTQEDGADEEEIKRSLLSLGLSVDEWCHPHAFESRNWLLNHVKDHGPVIMALDSYEHWTTAIGVCNDRFIVWDPAMGAGIKVYPWNALRTRWQLPKREGGPVYYGIGVSR